MKNMILIIILLLNTIIISYGQFVAFNDNIKPVDLHLPEYKQLLNFPNIWNYAIGGTLVAIGGAADGFNQVQRHHLYELLERHPNLNLDFWGSNQWKNKWELDIFGNPILNSKTGIFQPVYKEKFWGSSRWLVFMTDADHLTRTIDHVATISGVILIGSAFKDKPIWMYFVEVGGGFVIRTTAFWFVHDAIYK